MKIIFLLSLFILASCASSSLPRGERKEEKNLPEFSQSRSYVEATDEVMRAARAVLDDLSKESEPAAVGRIKMNGESIESPWIYGMSKDKYVEFSFNGSPKRKPLMVRRIYGFTITPSLAGSQVLLKVEEEIQEVDLKTGKERGWNSVEPDPRSFDMLSKSLSEKLRSL